MKKEHISDFRYYRPAFGGMADPEFRCKGVIKEGNSYCNGR